MLENGWEFSAEGDDLYGLDYLYQLYLKAAPDYEGRVTVPLLWDKQQQTIVNNESADIIRILNSAFDSITGNQLDFYPAALRAEIDAINQRVYDEINNGVYRAGFATTQAAYEKAYDALLRRWTGWKTGWRVGFIYWEIRSPRRTGDCLPRWFASMRSTTVTSNAIATACWSFRIYPAIWPGYTKPPVIAETVNLDHIKKHYYGSHKTINPTGIVPAKSRPGCSSLIDRLFSAAAFLIRCK